MLLKKIVVAEDDDAIAFMVTMALGDAGYLCIRARDGEEALHATKMHQPDLLVLDVMMPKMDGRQVAAKLKSDVLLSKVPILMLTALGDVESKVDGLDAGADDYMAKPFDLRELAARIRALIRANQRERDRNALTDLPGSFGVDRHIQECLARNEEIALVQIGVHGFSDNVMGQDLSASEAFIKSFANFLITAVRTKTGYLAHLGGTDFVAACSVANFSDMMDEMIRGFDKGVGQWIDQSGDLRLVSGAVFCTQECAVDDEPGFSKRLASAMGKSLAAEGSNYVLFEQIS